MCLAHWFWTYTCCNGYRIYTGGTGNTLAGNHWYKTRGELKRAKNRFIADGFEFLGDRSE